MPEFTSYDAGTPSWVDHASKDLEASNAFYGALFGWEAEDMPVGDGVYYSIQCKDGKEVAAISPQQQAQREARLKALGVRLYGAAVIAPGIIQFVLSVGCVSSIEQRSSVIRMRRQPTGQLRFRRFPICLGNQFFRLRQ